MNDFFKGCKIVKGFDPLGDDDVYDIENSEGKKLMYRYRKHNNYQKSFTSIEEAEKLMNSEDIDKRYNFDEWE